MNKIYVTGTAGFIGDVVSSRLSWDEKIKKEIVDIDNSTIPFWNDLKKGDIVVHMGGYSSTTSNDKSIYYKLNTNYTINLIDKCNEVGAKIIYASSASVYGNGNGPLCEYAKSKKAIDDYVEWHNLKAVGLRFFNVYGYGEHRKGKDASMIYHWRHDADLYEKVTAFKTDASRDFVSIEDVVDVIKFFINNYKPGIYDIGTGTSVKFDDVLNEILKLSNNNVEVNRIRIPKELRKQYQLYTCADLTKLREAGYTKEFISIYEGLRIYDY